MMKRVLQLIDGLNVGGAEILLRDLTDGLRERGWDVHVGYSTSGPLAAEMQAMDLPLTRLPRLARVDPLLLWGMFNLARRVRPHIVHTHLFKSDFHGRLAARLAGVPVVVSTLHTSDIWARNPLLGWLYGLTSRFADRLIAVSAEVAEHQHEHTWVPLEKMIVIENGVEVRRFSGQGTAGRAIRAEFNLPKDAFVFGIIGRLKPQKDHATFLRAAAQVKAELPAARFIIIGDGPLRGELEHQRRHLGLNGHVIFAGWRADIPAVMAALDVLVFSSRWEGLPVTLLEGMAAGRPVAATSVDGIRSVTVPEVTALLAEPGDPAGLATACLRLARDPGLRQRLGRAGQARVTQCYKLADMIDRTARLYDQLMEARGLAKA